MRLPAGSRDGQIRVPDGSESKADIDKAGNLSWGPVRLAGLHRVSYLEPGRDERVERLVAVNIADPAEARIAPVENLSVGTKEVQGVSIADSRRGALWPWVLALGLLVVLVEWWWYQRQIRL